MEPSPSTAMQAEESQLASRVRELSKSKSFAPLLQALQQGKGVGLTGIEGSSNAFAIAALLQQAAGSVVIVTSQPDDLLPLRAELELFGEKSVGLFPGWEIPPKESVHDEVYADRLRVLKHWLSRTQDPNSPVISEDEGDDDSVVVTSIQAMMQPVPPFQMLDHSTRTLSVGEEIDREAWVEWLTEQGMRKMTAVELPGEFSLRGGILDLFAPDWHHPVRIEFFDNEIESLRQFDVGSQRSLRKLDQIEISLLPTEMTHFDHAVAYFPENTWVVLLEPSELEICGRRWLEKLPRRKGLYTTESTLKRLLQFPVIACSPFEAGPWDTTAHLTIESAERFTGSLDSLSELLTRTAGKDEVFLICPSQAEIGHLTAALENCKLVRQNRLHYAIGNIRNGFRVLEQQTLYLSGSELLGRKVSNRPSTRHLSRSIDSFLELREGDYVVHLSHGIGRYLGMQLLHSDGHAEEHLQLEFAGGTKIYVPSSKIDLVQKYVGPTKRAPRLSSIGGKAWLKRKQAAETAVIDLASDMLQLQAMRSQRVGIRFAEDSVWMEQFEASFPYTETPDQLTCLEEIKTDMTQARPMDRLICGEVGFGKTELAMRAAFKAIDSGYQVAVLVPTTVLAEQHSHSFRERMTDFPFTIESLSRFRTRSEQQKVLEGLEDGSVDLVIGTHRLVQPDVRFQNLGLVIVDEEQRFGVEVKEKLKVLRSLVDILTLTATPIPRTLHMSLMGIRDISNLETPPADRLAVETRVARFDEELVQYAIRRELARGGQIFFVHNRIGQLKSLGQKLQMLVPELKLAIGHGQMPEEQLSRTMLEFVDGKFDLLLSTTIVESGLDIPNANTIFINDAERYGLAEMHQLRGRVGRYNRRAYCYLLIDPDKPLPSDAAKRLKAIEEFSSIGAGFAIAMRDLEIRGAGNLLGNEQSGHLAAIGYELYCQLLEGAVRKLKKMPPKARLETNLDLPGDAFLPATYISNMRQKIDLYRRLTRIESEQDLKELETELLDRFGAPPTPVQRLLRLTRLRLWSLGWGIRGIHLHDQYAVLQYQDANRVAELVLKSEGHLRVVDQREAYLHLVEWLRAQNFWNEAAEVETELNQNQDIILHALELLLQNSLA
ncbi:Transcription-repair-coupling factor [Planctomycetales bacterium 10988]|nr:Transcription-repair-coupling factor [Planctomycetales bacterium 10988]